MEPDEIITEFLNETKQWIYSLSSSNNDFRSLHFKNFFANIFVCYFLYDCIIKGKNIHINSIQSRINEIAKKISTEEPSKIIDDFNKLVENAELVTILAYEFFINYLYELFRDIYLRKLEYLKKVEKIEYKGYEIVDEVIKSGNSSEFIIRDLINLKFFGSKEESNLKTSPDFWLKLIDETKIELSAELKGFWEVFHDRRNAASHIDAKEKWEKIKNKIDSELFDVRIWLYGLLFLAYKIDEKFCSKFGIELVEIDMNFTRQPVYEMEQLNLSGKAKN